jgi:long-chain acyl-CoA synthetase
MSAQLQSPTPHAMPASPLSQVQTVHGVFEARLALGPERVLIEEHHRQWRMSDLSAMADTLTAELASLGVGPGDRVLVVAENSPQHVGLIVACSRLGAWSCGVNARMSSGEVAAITARCDPRVVYYTTENSQAAQTHAQGAQAQPSAVAGLHHGVTQQHALAAPEPLASRVAALIFTSGSTGTPKGVMITHEGLIQFAKVSCASRQLQAEDRAYAYVPMTHIFGLGTVLLAGLYSGSTLLMRSQFDPADVLDALAHQGLTQLQGPPTLYARLLAWLESQGITEVATPHLKYMYAGAAPLLLPLKERVESVMGHSLHHGYGLSEYAGILTVVRQHQGRPDTSAGYLVEGAEMRIVDAHCQDVALGERGEIWMRGKGLMAGYFNDTEATAAVMREGGWYASGDLGYQDPDGALYVVGRSKEMIIRSGFNVYPGEVEATLLRLPEVRHAAVVGAPEADGNETVVAFVELAPGAVLNETKWAAHLRDNLAPYKRPTRVEWVESMPMTLSGKVLKKDLLARLA